MGTLDKLLVFAAFSRMRRAVPRSMLKSSSFNNCTMPHPTNYEHTNSSPL